MKIGEFWILPSLQRLKNTEKEKSPLYTVRFVFICNQLTGLVSQINQTPLHIVSNFFKKLAPDFRRNCRSHRFCDTF